MRSIRMEGEIRSGGTYGKFESENWVGFAFREDVFTAELLVTLNKTYQAN